MMRRRFIKFKPPQPNARHADQRPIRPPPVLERPPEPPFSYEELKKLEQEQQSPPEPITPPNSAPKKNQSAPKQKSNSVPAPKSKGTPKMPSKANSDRKSGAKLNDSQNGSKKSKNGHSKPNSGRSDAQNGAAKSNGAQNMAPIEDSDSTASESPPEQPISTKNHTDWTFRHFISRFFVIFSFVFIFLHVVFMWLSAHASHYIPDHFKKH